MYSEQYAVLNKTTRAAFMSDWGLDVPTEAADVPLGDWYKFQLDRNNPSHRTQTVRRLYDIFHATYNAFSEAYFTWLNKYYFIQSAWESINRLMPEAAMLEKQLTKPLADYSWRNGGYVHKTANALYLVLENIAFYEEQFSHYLNVDDTPPVVDPDILRDFDNLLLQIKLETNKLANQKPKAKKVSVKSVTAHGTPHGSGYNFNVKTLRTALTSLTTPLVSFNNGETAYNLATIKEWLRYATNEVILGYNDDEYLTLQDNGGRVKLAAAFKPLRGATGLVNLVQNS